MTRQLPKPSTPVRTTPVSGPVTVPVPESLVTEPPVTEPPVTEPPDTVPEAPPEVTPVFVDRSGHRKWFLRLAALLVLAAAAVYVCMLAVVLTDPPSSESPSVVGTPTPALVAPAGTGGAVG